MHLNPIYEIDAAAVDAYFASVKFLSGFTGSEGAQVLTDESPAANAITKFGTATELGTYAAAAKFGATGLAVNKDNQSAGYCTVPVGTSFNFGTGDFTVEGWAYNRFADYVWYHALLGNWSGGATGSWVIFMRNTGELDFRAEGAAVIVGATDVRSLGWFHFAISRNSGTVRLFLNGVMQAKSTAYGGVNVGGTNPVAIGANQAGDNDRWRGYLDEVRITKGVGRYNSDANFTVPVAAYPRQ